MTTQYRQVPEYLQPRQKDNTTTASWYRYDQAMHLGTPPGSEQPIAVTTSPFTYQAKIGGFAIVTGGTVSAIHFTRNGVATYNTGQTQGTFPLSNGDSLVVTHAGAPDIVFVPQ